MQKKIAALRPATSVRSLDAYGVSCLDLGEIPTTLHEAYGAVAEDAGHKLDLDVPSDARIPLYGDGELLTQMFANLIENAIRHCETPARIEIGAHLGDAGAPFAFVRDSGPGIPAEERDRVFRRLYRLEKSRTSEGSRLGLSIVKAVADLHHATVALRDNAPGLAVAISFPAEGR